MRKPLFLIMLLCAVSLSFSCKKDKAFPYQNDFDASYQAWTSFRESSQNNYQYMVRTASWTGSYSETTLTIKAGNVVGRSFTAGYVDPETHRPVIVKTWTENGADIGLHESGAGVMTLDEVYDQARTDWLKKRNDAKTYFETKNQGMISTCGYVMNGCQDDCFTGIAITMIKKYSRRRGQRKNTLSKTLTCHIWTWCRDCYLPGEKTILPFLRHHFYGHQGQSEKYG